MLVNLYNTLPQQVEENRRKIKELEEKEVFKSVRIKLRSTDWELSEGRYVNNIPIADIDSNTMIIVALDDSHIVSPGVIDAYMCISQCYSVEQGVQLICLHEKPTLDFFVIIYYTV